MVNRSTQEEGSVNVINNSVHIRSTLLCRDQPVLIVHGDKREAKARLVQQAQGFPHVQFCQVTALY